MVKRVLVIAEAGVNHNGDVELARKLIDAALNAGADFIKFQTFDASRLATPYAQKAPYQLRVTNDESLQVDMLKRLEMSEAMHRLLISHCQLVGVRFLSSAFDIPSLDFLDSLGTDLFKIPSGELTNIPYIRHVGRFRRPVILSTGMSTLGEIELALTELEKAGTARSVVTVLHCNTEYPTPMSDVNLKAMCAIREAFGVAVGYSDHTSGIEVPIAAVALGATVIEKHLTLDRRLPGPDHRASLEPDEFTSMVRAIRSIELALGDGIKRPTRSELTNRVVVRKSIVAAKPIRAGDLFSNDNLTVKRPETGISSVHWDSVIGRRAPRDFLVDELIDL